MAGVGQCGSLKVGKCVGVYGVAKASGVRRCVRRMCGAGAAPGSD